MFGENLIQVGTLHKAGAPVNGRQNYEVVNHLQEKYTYSVPQENADKFEKLYAQTDDIMKEATTPETAQRLKEKGRSIGKNYKNLMVYGTIGGAAVGGLAPIITAITVKGSVVKRSILGGLGAIFGAGIGAAAALFAGVRYFTSKVTGVIADEPSFKKLNDVSNQIWDLGLKQEKKEKLTNA